MAEIKKKLTKKQEKSIQTIIERLKTDPDLLFWIELTINEYDKAVENKKKR